MKKITCSFVMLMVSVVLGASFMRGNAMAAEVPSEGTQELIEPFGGIKWNDSLMQLIGKLSAIKGVNHIVLHLSNENVDVRNVAKKAELEKRLSGLMLKYNSRIFKDLQPMTEQYTGKSGAKRKYILLTPQITASPIVIDGVAFDLKVKFAYAPGLEVVSPDAVLIEKTGGHAFPLVISEVSLTSSAAGLASRYQNIANLIETKYRKFDPEAARLVLKPDSGISGSVYDDDGNALNVRISSREASFIYVSEKYQTQLAESYRKYLAEGELKANSGKADMGAGL